MLAITEKFTTGDPHFIETGHLEPTNLPDDIIEKARNVVFHALDSLDVKYGASHSEIKINGNEIKIIEIGARMGGDFIGSMLVPMTTGIDYVKAVIDIALGKEPDTTSHTAHGACAIRFILNNEDIDMYKKVKKEHPEYLVADSIPEKVEGMVNDSSGRKGFFVMKANLPKQLKPYIPK